MPKKFRAETESCAVEAVKQAIHTNAHESCFKASEMHRHDQKREHEAKREVGRDRDADIEEQLVELRRVVILFGGS